MGVAHVWPLVNQSGALLPRENHPNTAAWVFVERNWCDCDKHTNACCLHMRAPSGVDVAGGLLRQSRFRGALALLCPGHLLTQFPHEGCWKE